MKLTVVYELTLDEDKLRATYYDHCVDDLKSIMSGENLDKQHYEGYSEEAVRLFARDAILGRQNHGTDSATEKKMTIRMHKPTQDVFHGGVRCAVCSKE